MRKQELVERALACAFHKKIPVCRSEYGAYLVKDLMDAVDAAGYDTILVDYSRAKDRQVITDALRNPAAAFRNPRPGRCAVMLDRIWLCEPMVLYWSVMEAEQLPEAGVPVFYLTDLWDDRFTDSAVYKVLDLDMADPDRPAPRYVPPPSHWDIKYGRVKKK